MGQTSIQQLAAFGQSVWLDNINRSLIEGGRLQEMIRQGLRGITSNPTIFDKAISSGNDYDRKIAQLCAQGKTTFEIYDELTIRDIQEATDAFLPVYKDSGGLDGYVSLEINPTLAYDTDATIEEGRRLSQKVNRPNLMLKVPSTSEGFAAVEELIACGINVNITLIFSVGQYVNTAHAYVKGIRRFLEGGGDASQIRSVASVFVSRIDTMVDSMLDEQTKKSNDRQAQEMLSAFRGSAAVANSKLIYQQYLDIFSTDEFRQLQGKGANIQRVLWGSTSTKNPAYSDIKYVTELIAKDTVNTVPDATFEAFLDHGQVHNAISSDFTGAQGVIEQLRRIDIDIDDVCSALLTKGVEAFEKSFTSLLKTIEAKKEKLCPKY